MEAGIDDRFTNCDDINGPKLKLKIQNVFYDDRCLKK